MGATEDPARAPKRTVLPDDRREPPVFLSREERIRRFRLDVGVESLHWHDCNPGGEYVKKLTIKNLGTDVQKLKYRLPATTFFSMAFPEPFKLSAGMSRTLEVSFRPIRKEPYDDYIEVFTSKGSMFIPIKATIPSTELSVPTNLDFGFWPVHERTTKTFVVRNLGELPASFRWESHAPFSIEPAAGTLRPYGHQTLRITFAPTEAVATVARFTCVQYDQHGELTRMRYPMRVGGIGKLPFLSVLSETIDFGRVHTGKQASQMFRLRNSAQVHASYAITRDEADREPVFAFSPALGSVPADGLKIISVVYRPKSSGTRTEEHYTVRTPGGNEVRLTLIGEAVGPRVELESASLDFGDVELRVPRPTARRVLTILNRSDAPVRYQLLADVNGTFALESGGKGTVGARSSASAMLAFSPDVPGNFYRRVYVLLENQAALFVDCLGSAFTDRAAGEARRPAPIKQRHVDNYHRRELFGWQRAPMDELDARRDELADLLEAHADLSDERGEGSVFRALFAVDARRSAPVFLEMEHADFGGSAGDSRRVRVVNTTEAKITCQWVVPRRYHIGGRAGRGRGGEGEENLPPCAFDVQPREIDVPAGSSAVVTVTFAPSAAAAAGYYAQELECFAFFKPMRTFRLVTEANFTPPWALVLTATGHTFGDGTPSWVPRASFSLPRVTFPATHVGDASYQTIALRNEGDTPLSFAFARDPTGVFEARPQCGVLESGHFCLVALRFAPRAVASVRRTLACVLNGSAASALQLGLHGQGERAAVELADNGEVFFRRTALGVSSTAAHALINRTRVPLVFQVLIPERYARVLAVDMPTGELAGNTRLELRWTFAPQLAKRYTIAVPILVSAAADGGAGSMHDVERAVLVLRGEGATGALKAEPKLVDFRTILVDEAAEQTFLLKNSSHVDLHYELEFDVVRPEGEPAGAAAGEPAGAEAGGAGGTAATVAGGGNAPFVEAARALLCEESRGVLPARTVRPIKLQMQPLRRGDLAYECFALFSTEPLPGADGPSAAAEPERAPRREHLCRIRGRGDYPILQLADVRLAGCEQVPLARLWRLQELNRELRAELSDVEAQLNSSAVGGIAGESDVATVAAMLQNFEVLFEPRPVGSEAQVAHVLLSNGGGLPVDWSIRYPTEMELEIEHWADKGEPTPTELKQHMIVDRRIFTVFPREGRLGVGESVRIEVVMLHTRVDRRYELPVMLRVAQGKRLVLRLVGRTLAPTERLLFLPHATHPLEAVPLGLAYAPVQYVPLTNHCAAPLAYTVRTREAEALNEANYGFRIFEVENPTGAIGPGETVNLRVRFHPLEARVYTVELPIELAAGGLGEGDVEGDAGGYGKARESAQGAKGHGLMLGGTGAALRGPGVSGGMAARGAQQPQRQRGPSDSGAPEHATLVLSARGYHPAAEARTTGEFTGFVRTVLPPHQLVVPPGQKAALSTDILDLGIVPVLSVLTRAVFVRNTSAETIAFVWRHKHADFALLASIEPAEGVVLPGESALCRVRVCAETRPEVLDLTLLCTITRAPANHAMHHASAYAGGGGGGGGLGASMRSGAGEVSFAATLTTAHAASAYGAYAASRATTSAASRRSAAASLAASIRTRGGDRTAVYAWRPRDAQVGAPRAPPHARPPKAEYGELPAGAHAHGAAANGARPRATMAAEQQDGGGEGPAALGDSVSQFGGSMGNGGGPGAGLHRSFSQRSVGSCRSGYAATSATVVSGFRPVREGFHSEPTELALNIRGIALELGHFTAHHKQRLPEMHVIVAAQRPLPPSLAPAPRPASPPLPLRAREMPSAAAALPGHARGRAEEERETAEALLETLLLDLVADADVQRALAHAPAKPIPWFTQLRDAPADYAWPLMEPPPLYPMLTPEEEAAAAASAGGLPPPVAAALARQRAAPPFDVMRTKAALSETVEFHELAEEVIEGSLFNLIAEAVLGEFDMTKPPRQIVTNLVTTFELPEGAGSQAGVPDSPPAPPRADEGVLPEAHGGDGDVLESGLGDVDHAALEAGQGGPAQ